MRFPSLLHRHTSAFAAMTLTTLLTACSIAPSPSAISSVQQHSKGISGLVHGGQQLVSGSTVQLWAVGTSGNGSAATPLLHTPVTSDSEGRFSITGDYSCPSDSTLVYLTASGGNPGLAEGTNNSALTMLAALGPCGNLSSSTYVVMNEITTTGTIFALAQYMTSSSSIGYSGDSSGINSAFGTVNQYVDISSGTPGGPDVPNGYGIDAALVNTVADILATCVNSADDDSDACGKLFALTGGGATTDIAMSALYLALHPTTNVTELFNLVNAQSPFQPTYSSAPSSGWGGIEQVRVAQPVISPNGGTYSSSQTVTITDTTPGVTPSIYYTTDGTMPTTNSTLYTGPITVSSTKAINAMAAAPGCLDSGFVSSSFFIGDTVPAPGTILTVAGNGSFGRYSGDGNQSTSALLASPLGVAVDNDGNIYIADTQNNSIHKVTTDGIISTVAGNGTPGYSGDGGPATSAELYQPNDVVVDSSGNLYIADTDNNRIRKVTTDGIISTVAGSGATGPDGGGFSGDGGAATSARLNLPLGLTVDSSGNLYIADTLNNRIRRVTTDGIISTIAGSSAIGIDGGGFSGDGSPATTAKLNLPYRVTTDSGGNIYLSDTFNNRIRKITSDGTISTIAGNGTDSYNGASGAATSVEVGNPYGLAVDSSGNLYLADALSNIIRKVTPTGTISTVAGNRTAGYTGDGGQATTTELNGASGIAVDSNGNLYIADTNNARIRKVTF